MSNNEPGNKKTRILQAVVGIVVIIFIYDQYNKQKEEKLISAYSIKNVRAVMKKLDLKPKVPVAEVIEVKKDQEVKVEAPQEVVIEKPDPFIKQTEPEIKDLEVKEEIALPAPVEKPVEEVKKVIPKHVFTPPPSYQYSGKGLVYDCTEKHWACVDGVTYSECLKNMDWNKFSNNPLECVTIQVYQSKTDFEIIQTQNISKPASTAFCLNEKKRKAKRK